MNKEIKNNIIEAVPFTKTDFERFATNLDYNNVYIDLFCGTIIEINKNMKYSSYVLVYTT